LTQLSLAYVLHLHLHCRAMARSLLIVLLILPYLVSSVSLSLHRLHEPANLDEELHRLHQAQPHEPKREDDPIPWYANVSMFHFPALYSMDVEGPQLLSSLAKSTAEYILVEFYAPWCPHCQHFAPEFERLSLDIHRRHEKPVRNAALTPKILTATVDCLKFAATCADWNVKGYPTLRWGKRSDWLTTDAPHALDTIDAEPMDAVSVADWINQKLSIKLDPSRVSRAELFPNGNVGPLEVKSPQPAQAQADAWDAQLAAALMVHVALGDGPLRGQKKDALLNLVGLLSTHFPEADSQRPCQKSFETLSIKLHSESSSVLHVDPDDLEKSWQPCGVPYSSYAHGWHGCRGTWPGKRGFTCGLWTLFHMLAAQSNDTDAKQHFQYLHDTVKEMFRCKECREHFMEIPLPSSSVAKPLTRRDLQLWWWNAHNIVNRRVMQIESKFQDADPGFPKLSWWPSKEVCPTCRSTAGSSLMGLGKVKEPASVDDAQLHEGFDLAELVSFLDMFYGANRSEPVVQGHGSLIRSDKKRLASLVDEAKMHVSIDERGDFAMMEENAQASRAKDASSENPCSSLGCNSHTCAWASGAVISRVVAKRGCSNAVAVGSGADETVGSKIVTLRDCVHAVKAQSSSCTGEFQLHKDLLTCSCVPAGGSCTEHDDANVCRYQIRAETVNQRV